MRQGTQNSLCKSGLCVRTYFGKRLLFCGSAFARARICGHVSMCSFLQRALWYIHVCTSVVTSLCDKGASKSASWGGDSLTREEDAHKHSVELGIS